MFYSERYMQSTLHAMGTSCNTYICSKYTNNSQDNIYSYFHELALHPKKCSSPKLSMFINFRQTSRSYKNVLIKKKNVFYS